MGKIYAYRVTIQKKDDFKKNFLNTVDQLVCFY